MPLPVVPARRRFVCKTQSSFLTSDSSGMTLQSLSRFVIDPNTNFYLVYSTFSLAVLAFDLTLLPYLLAWDVEIVGFLLVLSWATPSFWTLDMFITFRTAVYREGVMVSDPREIAQRYLRTWCLTDLAVVGACVCAARRF